jgi:hypothetical protein
MTTDVALPSFSFNTNDAPPAESTLIPEGWYTFTVAEAKPASRNDKTGKWSQNIQLKVIEGEHEKRIVYHNISLPIPEAYRDETQEKFMNARNYFLTTMAAFGFEGEIAFTNELLLGRTVRGQVKHETYDGETRAKIKKLARHTVDAQTLLG